MADDLFTSPQALEDENKLSAPLKEALAELRLHFGATTVQAHYWNSNYVAVALSVDVELPSRGPVAGVDIRPREDIFLLINRETYPYVAPTVRSNRRDLPKTKFPHINPTAPGQPAYFCLHRGSLDAWFAEHTIVDLVNRARGWLRDAARARLVPERDAFERTLVAETFGTLVYDPEKFIAEIHSAWPLSLGASGYCVAAYDLLDDAAKAEVGQKGYTVRFSIFAPGGTYDAHLGLAALLNEAAKKPEFKGRFQRRLFGVLVWGPESQRCNDHFGEIPTTLGAFFDWADAYQLPVRAALDAYLKEDLHLFGGIPLTIAIRRPMTVLGATTDIELINFVVHASGDHWPKDGSWDLAAEVSISDHRTPLSPEFARYLSSLDKSAETGRILLFGAGALGSKVAMHLGRSGQVNLRMIDQANFAPHNVVRHALGGESVRASKAGGVANAIVKLYTGMDDLPVKGESASALPFLVGDKLSELSDCQHVIDATASPVVFNALSNASIPTMTRVSRVEIADRGEIGILSVEGEARNPRLDDLQVLLYDSAIDDQLLSKWLTGVQARRDNQIGSGLEEIQIGLSCSSATMRIADEVVSYHAAAMTRRLRGYLTPTSSLSTGALFKSFISDDGDARAETLHVKPFAIVTARNNSAWQIRFASAVSDEMFSALKRASPSETGGLLVGLINKKRRVVYVTRLLRAPRDSTGTPAAFVRGVFNLPQAIRDIETRSGGLLGYVGEWHTHPEGGADLSPVDEIAVANLRSVLDPVDIPTLVSIVTPDGIHPHLLEASSPPIVPRLATRISLREFCLRLVRRNRRENGSIP